jgi:hypothetical protein
MMEAVRTSETSVDNHLTRRYNTEDSSEQKLFRLDVLFEHESVCSSVYFPLAILGEILW